MSSNMWQLRGAKSLTLILLLAVICTHGMAMPAEQQQQEQEQQQDQEGELMTTEIVVVQEPERIDCKLTFDATMDSLERQQLLLANGCNVHSHTSNTNKQTDVEQQQQEQELPTNVLRHSMSGGSSQPLYELQLVVWPTDIEEDTADTTTNRPTTTRRTTTPSTTTTTTTRRTTTTQKPSGLPLYEDQLAVFPQMDFEEENFDYFFDDLEAAATPPTPPTTTTPRPTAGANPSPTVYVLENYRKTHPNGTEEHKLVLSNGLVNYMKIYAKRVDNKLINVQEGYSSVPVAGLKPQIQTLHYIADEHGYNIYKMERSPFPSLLHHRVAQKATKPSVTKPHM